MLEMKSEVVGLVITRQGERARVKVDKERSRLQKVPKIIDAWCPINAKVGETVGIEYQEMNKTKSKIIVYGFPVLAVLAGAVFGNSLSIFFGIDKALPMILGVVVWLLIALNYVRIFKRDAMREGEQPVVVEIEPMGPIIMDDPLKKPEE